MTRLTLKEAFEKALPVNKPFLTAEQERRSDGPAVKLAHQLEESTAIIYAELRRKYHL